MSRVAKAPIQLPSNVTLSIGSDLISVKGPKGQVSQASHQSVKIHQEGHLITFSPVEGAVNGWAQAGTMRALLSNMVRGVTEGFTVSLELVGVGYRAQSKGRSLSLSLGYSHPIEYHLPEGVQAETPSVTSIVLSGINKQQVKQVASEIRAFRPPEPYKGKGIRYAGEVIIRKETKKK